MRRRSPSRTARWGLACSPFTSTLPPSQARLASERVLKRHATSSHTSRRTESLTTSDEDFDLPLRLERVHEHLRLLLAALALEILLDLRPDLVERHGPRRLTLGHANNVQAEVRFDEAAGLARLH